ncbi:sensor histidine kinase [Chitinimonas lacunae]|uniref:histidine kinase n=1 Tax=Chitinimonas lacunae TaxID=1963018 RepID=A0ABV8MP15_9NEIS
MNPALYLDDAALARWRADLAGPSEQWPVPVLIHLAWHLRQRDSRCALALADLAEEKLGASVALRTTLAATVLADGTVGELMADEDEVAESPALAARLALLRGEIAWLYADLGVAEQKLAEARQGFARADDPIGQGDSLLLAAQLAWDRGQPEARRQCLASALALFSEAGDVARQASAMGWIAYFANFERQTESIDALEAWARERPGQVEVTGFLDFCHAWDACGDGRYQDAADGWECAAERLQALGLIRLAITSFNNASTAAGNQSDFARESALAERALALARPHGWPFSMGQSLRSLGEAMRAVGDFAGALPVYEEAATCLKPLSRSWLYAVVTHELALVQLETGAFEQALAALEASEAAVVEGGHRGVLPSVLGRKALALSLTGRGTEALATAERALEASENGYHGAHDTVLEVLATIHLRHGLPSKRLELPAPQAALHYLDRYVAVKNITPGYIPEVSILADYATAWEQAGDLAKALDYERRRATLLESEGTQKAMQQVKALQLSNEAEKAKLAAEHQRQLAESESARARALETMSSTLLTLGELGQKITSCLDSRQVFEALTQHVAAMLDCQLVSIYQLNQAEGTLDMIVGLERGQPLAPMRIPLDSPESLTARAVREQTEILCDVDPGEEIANRLPGPRRIRTALFAPLSAEDRVLGAMSIQSELADAYSELERLIFRTLCAYGAIALNNAESYRKLDATLRELRQAQAQLVQTEKMASLGTLTAGIAHEINNPANFAHVGAQSLAVELESFREFLLALAGEEAPEALVASLNRRVDALIGQTDTVIEGTTRIRDLVRDLRTFARLDEAERKAVRIGDCLQPTLNLVRGQLAPYVQIDAELAANPTLECWPAQLSQVFLNLISNAYQAIVSRRRADPASPQGKLVIRSRQNGEWLEMSFQDNGCGMAPEVLPRIFEPFYTTKPVGEGTGLGLSISFGIVERHRGLIEVSSVEGEGSCFTVKLPVQEE